MDAKYDNIKTAPTIISHTETGVYASQRSLAQNTSDIFIRDGRSISIITKVTEQSSEYIQSFVSPLRPFGLRGYFVSDPNFHETSDGLTTPVVCIGKGLKKGYVERNLVPLHTNWIDRFKVIIPRANNIGTEANDDNLNAFVGKPNEICTESYLCIFADSNVSYDECEIFAYISNLALRGSCTVKRSQVKMLRPKHSVLSRRRTSRRKAILIGRFHLFKLTNNCMSNTILQTKKSHLLNQ